MLLFLGVFVVLQKVHVYVSSLNDEIILSKKFFKTNYFLIACVYVYIMVICIS